MEKIVTTPYTDHDNSQNNGFFVDPRDGRQYKWVKIKDQIIMAENLAFKTEFSEECKKFGGRYYQFNMLKKAIAGIDGWHIPSKDEFALLLNNIASSGKEQYQSLIVGGSSGLNFGLAGFYNRMGGYIENEGKDGVYWTNSEFNDNAIFALFLYGNLKEPDLYISSAYTWNLLRLFKD